MSVELLTEIVLDLEKRVRGLENSKQGREERSTVRFLLLKFLEQHAHSKDEFEDMSDFELAQRMIELNSNILKEVKELEERIIHLEEDAKEVEEYFENWNEALFKEKEGNLKLAKALAKLVTDVAKEADCASRLTGYVDILIIANMIEEHKGIIEEVLQKELYED